MSARPGPAKMHASMAIKQLNPYLNFNGTAGKAIELYQAILDSWLSYEHQRTGAMPGAPAGLSRPA